jgi:hypothetical protein
MVPSISSSILQTYLYCALQAVKSDFVDLELGLP